MNNLQLCQAAYRLVGEQGTLDSTTTATGFELVVVNAVREAWLDIQRERNDFTFRKTAQVVEVTEDKQVYTPSSDWSITNFGNYDYGMVLYDGRALTYYPYDLFYSLGYGSNVTTLNFNTGTVAFNIGDLVTDTVSAATAYVVEDPVVSSGTYAGGDAVGYVKVDYVLGTFGAGNSITNAVITTVDQPAGGEPDVWTVNNAANTFVINKLDGDYALTFHYYTAPESLSGDSDTPSYLPSEHHMLIVYRAVSELAVYMGESVLEKRYSLKYAQGLQQLMRMSVPAKSVKKRPIA